MAMSLKVSVTDLDTVAILVDTAGGASWPKIQSPIGEE